jgi:hypothetical protein
VKSPIFAELPIIILESSRVWDEGVIPLPAGNTAMRQPVPVATAILRSIQIKFRVYL